MLCVHSLVVCYSSNASFRIISDTTACIVSLLRFWQVGGVIYNNGGSVDISACRFVGNTAGDEENVVSDALCT